LCEPEGSVFQFDPVSPLVDSDDSTIRFWARRELLGERVGTVRDLWVSSPAQSLFRKQRPDGS